MRRRRHRRSPKETGRDGLGAKPQLRAWCWICLADIYRDAEDIAGIGIWCCGQAGACISALLCLHCTLCLVPSMEEILADSEEEEEEEEERRRGKVRKKQARQKGQAWLKEGEEDEPLNFLDPNVSQRVLGEQQSLCSGVQLTGERALPQALTHLCV